jgi:hypothetical protein
MAPRAYSRARVAAKAGRFFGTAAAPVLVPVIWRYAMRIVSLILLVFGWVVVLVGAFGTGIDVTVGNLDPLTTGIVLVLGGLTLRTVP